MVNKSGELENKELINELLPIFYNSVPDVNFVFRRNRRHK